MNNIPNFLKAIVFVHKESEEYPNNVEKFTNLHEFLHDQLLLFVKKEETKTKEIQTVKPKTHDIPTEEKKNMEFETTKKAIEVQIKKNLENHRMNNNSDEELEKTKKSEEKKEENYLSKEELEFLERFYFLLDINKTHFMKLSNSEKISLLENKYVEYITKLSKNSGKLKEELEKLGLMYSEEYIISNENQYMYHELQELKFFLNSLKKAKIINLAITKDEMFEKAKEFLNNDYKKLSYYELSLALHTLLNKSANSSELINLSNFPQTMQQQNNDLSN